MKNTPKILALQKALENQSDLELAILVGSQVENRVHENSDWDIAIQWTRSLDMMENLAATETLRRYLGNILEVGEDKVDLINIPNAGLAMRALIAESGIPLKGEDCLSWNHLLGRTWRELENYEWEKQHAS